MKIKITHNSEDIREIDLTDEVGDEVETNVLLWIGRSESCHVVLNDLQVSREHAQLQYAEGKWSIQAPTPANQLKVNGATTEKSELCAGDVIGIGPYSLEILEDKETLEVAESEEPLQSDEVSDVPPDESEEKEEGQEEEQVEDISEGDEVFANSETEEQGSDAFVENDGNLFEEEEFKEEEEESDEVEYPLEAVEEEGKTKIIQGFSKFTLDIFGEYAPYDTYIIEKNETLIGRDPEKCQIVLPDREVSGVHATIKRFQSNVVLEDMNSGNGTLLNGERINKSELKNGDEFIIGSTTFTTRLESDFIQDEQQRLMPVEENQVVDVEEVVEVDEGFEGDLEEEKTEKDDSLVGKIKGLLSKDALRDPVKRKKLLYGAVGLMLVWLLLDSPEEKKVVQNSKKEKTGKSNKKKGKKKALRPEVLELVDSTYQLALELFETAKYTEAIYELDKIFQKVPDYKRARALYQASKDALKELELIEKKERQLKALIEKKKKIKELLTKAEQAVKEKRVAFAEQLFIQVTQLDPENIEVVQLKLELDHYKKEVERKAIEKAAKEAERTRQETALVPGKTLYIQKKWHFAILKLDELINKEKNMDKDLLEEANKMLSESRKNLKQIIQPLLAKARSLKESKDLKGSYESYLEVLTHGPDNVEALNEMDDIRDRLRLRSRRAYREAIISESLSLFNQAKEKFQEVQQISPVDSEYYKKATEKLKDYLE